MYNINSEKKINYIDIQHLALIRKNVSDFLCRAGKNWGNKPARLLDIAPQDYEGARPFFDKRVLIETIDINPLSKATYIGDICQKNNNIPNNYFDLIVCTEVLEHTLQPFDAIKEIRRILSPGGVLLLSTPFNFRIHGPLPDCWRFSEHGLRALLKNFHVVELSTLETEDRFLMPIHYTVKACKPNV